MIWQILGKNNLHLRDRLSFTINTPVFKANNLHLSYIIKQKPGEEWVDQIFNFYDKIKNKIISDLSKGKILFLLGRLKKGEVIKFRLRPALPLQPRNKNRHVSNLTPPLLAKKRIKMFQIIVLSVPPLHYFSNCFRKSLKKLLLFTL